MILVVVLSALVVGPVWLYVLLVRPAWAMTIAFGLMPFQFALFGEMSAVRLSIVDVAAATLLLPLAIRVARTGRLRAGATFVPAVAFLSLAAVSTAVEEFSTNAVVSLVRMAMMTLVPVLIYANLGDHPTDRRRAFQAFLAGAFVLAAAVGLGFVAGGSQGGMYALGLNKNFTGPVLGCGVCTSVVFLLTDRPRGVRFVWLVIAASASAVGLLLCLSRGAWIATVVAMVVVFVATRNVLAIGVTVVISVVLLAAVWSVLDAKSTEYAGDVSANAESIRLRLQYIDVVKKEFDRSPVFGVGVGLRKRIEPHNVFILTAGEMGVVGVLALAALFGSGFWVLWRAWSVTHDPVVLMAAAVFTISVIDGMMDVYWRRGVGFMGWAGVGMATAIGHRRRVVAPREYEVVPA